MTSKGWSFRSRIQDIDGARIVREAEVAGLEMISVTLERVPDAPRPLLIRKSLCHWIQGFELGASRFAKVSCTQGVPVSWYRQGGRVCVLHESCEDSGLGLDDEWYSLGGIEPDELRELVDACQLLDDETPRVVVRAV